MTGTTVSFVSDVTDISAFSDLLLAYYTEVQQLAEAAGLNMIVPQELVASSIAHLDDMLPPGGRLALARRSDGALVGCATLRRIRPDAVEMKRMFVRPEARGQGLGRRLFDMRIEEAKAMGCRLVYADTVKGNRAMLSIYERFGFRYIARYPENANPVAFAPYLVYLERRIDGTEGGSAG